MQEDRYLSILGILCIVFRLTVKKLSTTYILCANRTSQKHRPDRILNSMKQTYQFHISYTAESQLFTQSLVILQKKIYINAVFHTEAETGSHGL